MRRVDQEEVAEVIAVEIKAGYHNGIKITFTDRGDKYRGMHLSILFALF